MPEHLLPEHLLLNTLNKQQRAALEQINTPVLVLGGAGSGKTQLLTYKYAYLYSLDKKKYGSIMAVTFNNKAAMDMRERITYLLSQDLSDSWIGTFYSLCNRILRKEQPLTGLKDTFVIYDADDQCKLIRHILNDMKIYEALYRGIVTKIGCFKSTLVLPDELASSSSNFDFDEKLLKVYVRYQDEMRRSNALDFDDLIIYTIKLFQEHPQVLQRYQQQLSYILVDEFQDTNFAQYQFLKLLGSEAANILVAGDYDQSIYKMRGGENENVLTKFEADFPSTAIINLTQNYRSTENILRVSHSVIVNSHCPPSDDLWTDRGIGEKVCHYWFMSEEEEAKYVAKNIKDMYLKGSCAYEDMAILYRVNLQCRVLEEALRNERIPFKIIGSACFYQKKEIKDLIAYLKLIVNKDDNVSMRRVMSLSSRAIGLSTITRLENESKRQGISIYRAMRQLTAPKGFSVTARERLTNLLDTLEAISIAPLSNLNDAIKLIGTHTGYIEKLDEVCLNNISELMYLHGTVPLEVFLDTVSLTTFNDDVVTRGHVSMTTLHNVKGLEFSIVFITGLEDGLLPYFKATETTEELNEERRLFYMGMTRAKDILFMTGAKRRRLYTKFQDQEPSRFLNDIPKDCCFWVEKKPIPANISTKFQIDKPPAMEFPYNTGCRVRHPKWGIGIIRECYGEENDIKVTVSFPTVGIKRLALKYANLERI
ncbi:UvrD-helicase domain-containing protein [Candidatus Magnetobacterium casense]|uniref:DNA 3'-5' helicase n=1 Tax=Candidatus Magnetobacterium casense TaxID=1455061 RepID=A0ABS6RX94_9BACT|nr:UvrD-helicase domain-containing protein [Candidatus Magnetobacterium casensis]MBV6341248.1 UvrD-helicase domain-containing protein [Candidatus Magnetobacterium casensis]